MDSLVFQTGAAKKNCKCLKDMLDFRARPLVSQLRNTHDYRFYDWLTCLLKQPSLKYPMKMAQ
ncbi:hypothetical protein OUZ56_015838 [Daphnia magna]|uniref:Uncharacterized protein n=1 Tax=Daphnia magna TaxID=35525 RepID=A0ABR0ANW7_9CRUS|nr:hypothetical protein OUZ56_015838 [Daphnia magna]